jgi:alkylhydroperoxidase family enzyme
VAAHLELLRGLGIEKPLGRTLATNYEKAPVGENVQALFRFADKLTRKPYDVTQDDADGVKAAGWEEAALFEAVLVVALMNFANRFAIGLGLMADF